MINRRPNRRHLAPTSKAKRPQSRPLHHERLERRELLAAEILAIRPDSGGLLQDNEVLNVAPREFNLFFNGGANLRESTINSNTVRLTRSGGDGSFTNGNEIDVALGFVGLVNPGTTLVSERQQIVMRPASSASHNATDSRFAFPDDFYQIRIVGSGSPRLESNDGSAFGGGVDYVINFRLDRGAQVVAVVPQPVSREANGNLKQASDQIVVYFDNQQLNDNDATDPKYFRLVDTSATLEDQDDKTLLPVTASYDPSLNRVLLTFATDIPEGSYRLDIGASGGLDGDLASALRVGTLFDRNPIHFNGFLGDSAGVSTDASDVDLYRVELIAGSTINIEVETHDPSLQIAYSLLGSNGALLQSANTPSLISHAVTTTGTYYIRLASVNGSTGSYALNASVTGNPLVISDANSTFGSANDLGRLGAAGLTLSSSISPQGVALPPWPGGTDEPGHRQIQREVHIGSAGTEPLPPSAIAQIRYHFPPSFPNSTSPGEVFLNQITEEEKRIVRTLFDMIASKSGYQFIESSTGGLAIGKTDLRAFDPSMPPGAGVAGLGGPAGAIVNASQFQDVDRFFGDGFTGVMFHEIGHAVGLGHAYELPALMGPGSGSDVLLTDHDVVHLQRIVPPNSTDIDMYRFQVDQPGRFKAETIAQRLDDTSLLSTVLQLYREMPDGSRELIARNERYFGTDSFIDLQLEPGVYFVGVTSVGNDKYDPNVPDSGYGGTTDGNYDLKLSFDADRQSTLLDADGTPIDGDGDGTPGGVHSFWFQAAEASTTIFVDRENDPLLGGTGGTGSVSNPFDRLSKAISEAGTRIIVPNNALSSIQSGDSFIVNDGLTDRTFFFSSTDINLTGLTTPQQIATAIAARINISIPGAATAIGRVVKLTGIERLDLSGSASLLTAPNIIRVAGNGGTDGNVTTLSNNRPYLLGTDTSGNPLRDGAEFLVPQGVTVMIDAGVLIKLRKSNLDAGTSSVNISREGSAIQVLGTPFTPVWLRSYHDDTAGGNSDGVGPAARPGDFGGIVFRGDSDLEGEGIFLNSVTHLDVRHGGGKVFVDSAESVFTPIHIDDARPAVRFNRIFENADAAISANPDSFDDSLGRIGPEIVGNFLQQNTINGLFIRIVTEAGSTTEKLSLFGRLDDTDITHILTENLLINGNPGGPIAVGGALEARPAGRLVIDPGVVMKLKNARIEAERGASSVIAEGTPNSPVIFTSFSDDRFGGSGTFDSNANGRSTGSAGDWSGLYFGHLSSGSIDNAILTFGGGNSPIEGGSTNFNVLEVHEADLRVTDSLIRDNASGLASGVRNGRGANAASTIYIRGSQPVIVGNTIVSNAGAVANANANSLNYQTNPDYGRATGSAEVYARFADNHGPLFRLNKLSGNSTNGLVVRGEELTTEGIWDDTDIVHVVQSTITVDNFHTYGGLRLQSSNSESLVVKFSGANAGITATGTPLDIVDRIGGTVQILGQPGFPVVLTHLADDSVGAGYAPNGTVMTNTDNTTNSVGVVGGWRGLLFDQWSNDTNVAIVRESESPLTAGKDINRTPGTAQYLGELAPNLKSGDENRRLGFEVQGFISPDDSRDVDVYSFRGTAGTPIWIDIDRTNPTLDSIIELVNANGTVLARSVRSSDNNFPGNLNSQSLSQNPVLGGDFFTQNFRDAGLHYILPGTTGNVGTYFIRVRSNPQTASITDLDGKSSGAYQLQVRLQQVDVFPGSTVRFADIRFAQTAINVQGLPRRSPLIGEAGELPGQLGVGDTIGGSQPLVNLLQTDMAVIGLQGVLDSGLDIDWYRFDVQHTGIQVIPGVNDSAGTVAVVFDIDYADGLNRADTTIAVYNSTGKLIWVGRESNIQDDLQLDGSGKMNDLSRGSAGRKDAYIGPIHLTPTTGDNDFYYLAVMSNQRAPGELLGYYGSTLPPDGTNRQNVRLEPANSVQRVVEDHIGFQGYSSNGSPIAPETNGIFDISSKTAINAHVTPFTLKDVVLYVATDQAETDTSLGSNDRLFTVNPHAGERYLTQVSPEASGIVSGVNDVQDIVIRSDGRMFGYQRLNGATNSVGALVEIDPTTGTTTLVGNDNINGESPTPNVADLNQNVGSSTLRAEQFTTSDEVDALTFQRTGDSGGANPVPRYDTYLVVRETAITGQPSNSKLYRGRANGSAAYGIDAGTYYGVLGNIQPTGVSYASTILTAVDGASPNPNRTNIRIESKLPGLAGNNITLNISRPDTNTNAVVNSVFGTTINLQIGGTGGPPPTAGPSAAAIVDAINNHPQAKQLVTAVIVGGNGANGTGANGTAAVSVNTGSISLAGGAEGAAGVLAGRVTGISYANFLSTGDLFGVTTAGEFLRINPSSGQATVLSTQTGINFQGLTLGPQNVENGAYSNMLFATASNGNLYAFNTAGQLQPIFAGGATTIQVTGLGSNAIGLAFSPLDFNLWHPTMKRSGDVGHGINAAPDDSRTPGAVSLSILDPGSGPDRDSSQASGGASFHFGFEQWVQTPTSGSASYLTYESSQNSQLGILTTVQHADLSSNPNIRNTYNMPGGAIGSLVSSSFSLAGSAPQDRPTLYFNYFLETENHPGSNVTSDANDPFRDSARVFISANNGATWSLVATNSSLLSGPNPTVTSQRAELPGFISHLSDAGLNSSTPRAQSHQIVQELVDNTGQWRQARIDLSTYANSPNLRLRIDFSTAGAMRDTTLGFTDTNFGEFVSGSTPRSVRSTNNAFEGFYIDDIIVGYAERGEMVTGNFSSGINSIDLAAAGAKSRNLDPNRNPDNLTGRYQVEIRRVDDLATWDARLGGIAYGATFDTNDRHINELQITGRNGYEAGEPFDNSLPPASELRELISVLSPGTSLPPGPFVDALLVSSFEEWDVETSPNVDPITGVRSFASPAVYRNDLNSQISAALPGNPTQRIAAIYRETPASLGATGTGRGVIRFKYSVSSLLDTHGLLFLIDGQPQVLVEPPAPVEGDLTEPPNVLASGERRSVSVQFPFSSENSELTWIYLFSQDQNQSAGSNRAWIDDIMFLQGNGATGFEADRNRQRPQGMFVVEANTITNSAQVGINVAPGAEEAGGSVPHPGSTINFAQINDERLIPGVVIQNNIIARSSAIRYAGETQADPQRPVPFARIVNNTLVGTGSGIGTGLEIVGNASPTVMNNIFTRFSVGISGNTGGGAVIRSNYYQGNTSNGPVGTDALLGTTTTPLFVDEANRNFYLVSGSAAVDSSLNTLQDRFNYVNFKQELDIPPSPIFAPDRDVYGQLRVDSGQSPGGGGSSIFKDRGAVDRADFDAPFAVLLDPIDNDISGFDKDPNDTVVSLSDPIVASFSILLGDGRGPNSPFEGTGIDPLTVSRSAVKVRRNNVELIEGSDYVLGFNPSTGEMRLTPLSTLWQPGGVYEITLDNKVIKDRAGNFLRNNQADGSTKFIIILPEVGLDFGDAPDSYSTALASDGARHALIDGARLRFGSYVDAENDARSPSDDQPTAIAVSVVQGTGFQISNSGTSRVTIGISALPVSGDSVHIDIGSDSETFELVTGGVAPKAGNHAVRFSISDDVTSIANKLVAAISQRLGTDGDGFSVARTAATAIPTLELENLDDEDGIGVGTLTHSSTDHIVFMRSVMSPLSYPTSTTNNDDALGFLNPLDPAGAKVGIIVSGVTSSARLDAWVDFNGNGVFETTEKVLDSISVINGENIVSIFTPVGTTDKVTWSRFRLSPEGGLEPSGLAVGGEVEDHRVQIVNVDLPVAKNDPSVPGDRVYRFNEDSFLDTLTGGFASIKGNDYVDSDNFMPIDAILVTGPTQASSFVLNRRTGHFTYVPKPDFAGIDTFTYYLASQQSAIDANIGVTKPTIATVTIDVRPVNDQPLASPQSFTALESQPDSPAGRGRDPLTITANDLLQNAKPHNNPQYPTPSAPEGPWDERAQSLRVKEVILPKVNPDGSVSTDGDVISIANAAADGTVTVRTVRGTLVARFVTSTSGGVPFKDSYGSLVSLTYTSDDYLNRDNVPLIPTSVTGRPGEAFDFIRFTIEDDGLLIDPSTVNDTTFGLISNDQFFAPQLQHTAIAVITVTPQNDIPIPSLDIVSVGTIGQGVGNPSGSTTPIDSTTAWSQYFVGLGQPVPVPTEDQQLIIPAAFLILNDRQGNSLSTDENAGSNDGTLRIASVSMATVPASGGGSVLVNAAGDVVFTAPKDYYGNIVFTYVVQDSGIDESTNGNRVVAPLTAVSTVTVAVQPVNDPPVPFDRRLTYVESGNAGVDQFSFTAQQLLTGSTGETPAAPGSLTPLLVAPFNESEQSLRVVGFSTGNGSVDVNQLPNHTGPGTGSGTLTLATDAGGRFEFDFTNGAATNIRFFTRDDYNEVAPFSPEELLRFTIEDNGQTTDPQTNAVISLPAVRSVIQATLTLTVKPTNDAPIFTLPTSGFIFDENDGSPVSAVNFATTVAPGPLTALDELRLQDMSFTFTEVNVPAGLMKSLPTIVINGGPENWPGMGLITAYPSADAFGFAVYDVTATDNHPTDPRSTTQRLTITINPLNDKPVTYGRSMSVLEAVESDATTARIDFDARRLIEGNSGEIPSVAGLFPSGLISPYNETEQTLRVVRFIVPGAANVDVTVDEPGLTAGTGSVIRRTVTGGTLTFNFVNGAFTNGSYVPATDYNERTPFQATDPFSFVIQDDAKTTLPGSGFVNYGGTSADSTIFPPQGSPPLAELRSDPAVVTLTVIQRNDPPIFTIPTGFSFSENNGQAVVGSDFATSIAPSEMTALDELARQGVAFSFTEVNVPAGLMTALPTLVTAGAAGNWSASGTLTVFPAADAFGFAVYDVTATDDDPINPRFTTKRVTITINPINDKPVTYDRSLSVREGVESDGDSVRIDFNASRLIAGAGSETPSVAGLFPSELASPYNEGEQSLRVVRFIIPGATDVDVAVDEPGLMGGNGAVTRTTATGGMLSFTFVGGAFTSGSYVPATDYNERTPFAPADPFSFVIQDDAKSTLPGSGFIDFGGNSFDTTLFPPQGSPPLAELRSDPATVTITVTEKNDPPIFTMANGFSFNENSGSTVTQTAFVSGVAPSQLTARDELERQQVVFTFREVNVPTGLMTALPRILVNGGPTDWPGSGNLEVFPSADAFGFAVYDVTATDNDPTDPRSTTKRLTIAINPINDNPVTFDRTMRITEAIESDGQVVILPFDANRLIFGEGSETSSMAGQFQPNLIAPYNETEQNLRVVRFLVPGATPVDVAVDEPGLTGGTGQVTRTTVTGGKLTFNFVNGAFTNGTYEPEVDYNENSVDMIDPFGFVIQDNARTTLPGSGFINYSGSSTDSTIFPPQGTPSLQEERSLPATVTIVVTQTNDPPEFVAQPTVEILERDDSGATRINNFATAVRPAPSTAFDELATQFVSFVIIPGESVVPTGLMRQDPVITVNGGPGNWPGTADIRIFPSPDAVGTAIYVYEAIDSLPSNPNFVPQSTRGTVTIHVRPVNDAPRPNPAIAGTSASLNADEAWSVNPAGVITFTLKEDNTQSGGFTQPYSINARANLGGPGYSRLGLLDAFVVGPGNEADSTLGGSQNLRILSFDQTTARGGSIQATAFDPNGYPITFSYTPPKDYNLLLGAVDSFNYVVEDFNTPGQTWNLGLGGLQQNRLTINGRAEFLLRPVNDAPLFNLASQQISVLEDSGTFGTNGFATDIFAGPLATAIDEVDPVSGQKVSFLVTPTNPSSSALFTSAPTISSTGRLTFTPAKDAYGTAVFEVRAVDTGANDVSRGDLAISSPQTITINIRPQNDNPILNTTNPIVFSLNEDGTILNPGGALTFEGTFIPLRGTTGSPGLLDIFSVGPANEAADITPGGNQKLVMANPIPAATAQGGTLTKVFDPQSSELIGLRYMPRQNYNGTDSFIYGVIDDGVSANVDGSVYADPKESFTIVSLVVRPLNDPPQFSGAMSVNVLEDAVTTPTVGQTIIPGFATDIAAGPPGAFDELGLIPGIPGQTVSFVITPMVTNPAGLFSIPPAVSPDGRLTFVTAPDANGVAVFTIYALDSGAHNPPLEINRSGLRTFSVTVTPVNDAPSFNLIATQVQVAEDSGPFTSATPFATNILPGPPDEVAAGQTVRFEVTTPVADQTLFSSLPTVTDTGFLRFTPATSAVGRSVISIVAIDSEGMPSQPKLVTLTIGEVNDPPIASNVSLAGDEDHVVSITAQSLIALATDPDLATNPNESLRVTNVSTASQSGATIRVLASGNIEYDPRQAQALQALRPGQQIVDTFTYQIVDSQGALSNVATISITVDGINDAPTVIDDFATLNPVGPIVIRPLLNDFDVDGTIDVRTVQISLLPAFGTVEVRNDGTLLYTPFEGFRGTDTLRYTVADDLGARSESATITIDTNQAPIAVADQVITYRDRAVDINVAANDSDPDGSLDLSSIVIVSPAARGTTIVLGGGIVRYVPQSDFVGIDTFRYTIRDNRGRPSNIADVRVQVVASELQNPSNATDVDASGQTSPIDALLILNRLARSGQPGIPIENLINELPRRYYDVDGNRMVEPLDALLVINHIARQNATGEGESDLAVAGVGTINATPPLQASRQELNRVVQLDFTAQNLLEDPPIIDTPDELWIEDEDDGLGDLIGLLAKDQDEKADAAPIEDIDRAFGGLDL